MASEDSDEFVSGFPPIHRLSNPNDLDETIAGQMLAGRDALYARGEPVEVLLLRGSHGMPPEVRDNPLQQILAPTDDVSVQVLAVVVVALVRHYLTHPEVGTEIAEALNARNALSHSELVRHLIAGSVAGSAWPVRLPDKAD